jgi:hypothetical protein
MNLSAPKKNNQRHSIGQSIYIRCPPSNSPVKDLKSSAMACNVNNEAAPQKVTVKPGDKLTCLFGPFPFTPRAILPDNAVQLNGTTTREPLEMISLPPRTKAPSWFIWHLRPPTVLETSGSSSGRTPARPQIGRSISSLLQKEDTTSTSPTLLPATTC